MEFDKLRHYPPPGREHQRATWLILAPPPGTLAIAGGYLQGRRGLGLGRGRELQAEGAGAGEVHEDGLLQELLLQELPQELPPHELPPHPPPQSAPLSGAGQITGVCSPKYSG